MFFHHLTAGVILSYTAYVLLSPFFGPSACSKQCGACSSLCKVPLKKTQNKRKKP